MNTPVWMLQFEDMSVPCELFCGGSNRIFQAAMISTDDYLVKN